MLFILFLHQSIILLRQWQLLVTHTVVTGPGTTHTAENIMLIFQEMLFPLPLLQGFTDQMKTSGDKTHLESELTFLSICYIYFIWLPLIFISKRNWNIFSLKHCSSSWRQTVPRLLPTLSVFRNTSSKSGKPKRLGCWQLCNTKEAQEYLSDLLCRQSMSQSVLAHMQQSHLDFPRLLPCCSVTDCSASLQLQSPLVPWSHTGWWSRLQQNANASQTLGAYMF